MHFGTNSAGEPVNGSLRKTDGLTATYVINKTDIYTGGSHTQLKAGSNNHALLWSLPYVDVGKAPFGELDKH